MDNKRPTETRRWTETCTETLTVGVCITVVLVELILVLEEEALAGPRHGGHVRVVAERHLREHGARRAHHHHLPVRRAEQHLQRPRRDALTVAADGRVRLRV